MRPGLTTDGKWSAMLIIRLFMGSIVGMIIGAILLVIGIFGLFIVVVGALALSGGPADCAPGDGPITVDAAHSDAFQQKWNGFNAIVDGGAPSSITLSESEISSRADTFLREKSGPFKEPRVCLHDGSGEGQAKIAFLGLTAKVKVKGSLDLTGQHPQAKIDSIKVGNVPGWLMGPAESFVNRAIDNALNDVRLEHRCSVAINPGEAGVTGTP